MRIKNNLTHLYLTISLTILLQSLVLAKDTDSDSGWRKIQLMNKLQSTGHFQAFIMDKMIYANGNSISPARIVFYQIPLTERNTNLSSNQSIWNVVSKGMELTNITSETDSNGYSIMTGVWPAPNRIIQVIISRDEKYLRYSIANYRRSYHEVYGQEISDLQKKLTANPNLNVKSAVINYLNFNLYAETNNFDGSIPAQDSSYQVPGYVNSALDTIFTQDNVSQVLSFAASAAGVSFLSNIAGGAVSALFEFFSGANRERSEQEIIQKLLEAKRSFEEATEHLRTIERGLDQLYQQALEHPEWLSNRTYPQLIEDIATLSVGLTEEASARRQVLREERMKQIRGLPVDCVDCLENLPVEIARLDEQISLVDRVQARLQTSTSICDLMKDDLDRLIEIEGNLFNLYNGIFSQHRIEDLREVISSQAQRQQARAVQAQTNTRETATQCRNRVERVFRPILEDRLERNNLNWDVEDLAESCHLGWCLVGEVRHQEVERMSRRERRNQSIQCESEGMWDIFRGHTPRARYQKCQRLVGAMNEIRNTRKAEITEQYNSEKAERLRACDQIAQQRTTNPETIDTIILTEVNRNLEFLESLIRNQNDVRTRIESYQIKKRTLAEICPDI